MEIRLVPMSREYAHEFFRGFVYDADTFQDMSLYEKAKNSAYDPQRVDTLFIRHSREEDRRSFAVLLSKAVIGELELKHINPEEKTCELGIHLQSDAFKDQGFGTQAARLAITYAFDTLGMDRILANSVEKNHRSQHVLEKLGFTCMGKENGFKQYQMGRTDQRM